MTKKFFNRLESNLKSRQDSHLYREPILYNDYKYNLASNDYFQLRSHPNVIKGAIKACEKYGSGSGASPLLSGFLQCHKDLLDEILHWKQKKYGMLFNSGFTANQALLKHLPGNKDLVMADKLIHHSIAQGLLQSSAKFKRYAHLDLIDLKKKLEKYSKQFETVFVVTESVFSMDGDYPDLVNLINLKNQFPFILILDEAHGTGVFGQNGGGLAEEMKILPEVDILVGTLGKSLASMGAYVLSNDIAIIKYLTNVAGEYIYSTFLPPAQAGAAHESIKLIKDLNKEREKVRNLSKYFRSSLKPNNILYESPIIPILIGDPMETLILRDSLLEKGILVGAVRPPTVPERSSRLRISLHSGVEKSLVDEILKLLNKCNKN